MSHTPESSTGSLSRWWILLLVPAALPIGWWMGRQDGPKPQSPEAASSHVATTTAAPREPTRANTPTPAAGIDVSTRPYEAAPAPAPQPVKIIRPSEVVSQWTDLRSAISESESNGKPVLIDFSADWCGPCQRLKRQVFDDWTKGQAVQAAVIPVSIVDRRREQGSNPLEVEDLYRRFEVDAFPTLVVFMPATGRSVRTQGFGGADATLAWITEAAQAVR